MFKQYIQRCFMNKVQFMAAVLFFHGFMGNLLALPQSDLDQINNTMRIFAESVHKKDHEKIRSVLTKKNPELVSAVLQKVNRLELYRLQAGRFEELMPGKRVKLNGTYEERFVRFKVFGYSFYNACGGLSTYFVLEKRGDNWLIVDTDFHKGLLQKSTWGSWLLFLWTMIMWFWLMLAPIFWIWMIIDCAKYCTENKTKWLILLVLFNIITAVIYYFWIKRKREIDGSLFNRDDVAA